MKSTLNASWSARLSSCCNIGEIRRLHADCRVEHGSSIYKDVVNRWRRLCRLVIWRLNYDEESNPNEWRALYNICPSGTPEEAIALGAWQVYTEHDPDLAQYRERVSAEARRIAREEFREIGL